MGSVQPVRLRARERVEDKARDAVLRGAAVAQQGIAVTEARFRVVEALRRFGNSPVTLGELAEEAGCGPSVVKGLVKLGVIAEEDTPRDLPYPPLVPQPATHLRGDQVAAADALVGQIGGVLRPLC